MQILKKNLTNRNLFFDSLIKNSLYLMLSTIFAASSGFVFWYFGAKFYSEENVGLAAAIASVVGLISLFSRCGLDIGIIRYLSNEKDKNGMINSCLIIVSITSVVLTCVFLLGIRIFSPELLFLRSNFFLALLLVVFTASNSLYLTQSNIFTSLRCAKYSFLQTLIATLRIIIIPLLITWGITGIYVSYGLGLFIACIFGNLFIYKAHSSYKPEFIIKKNILSKIFHFSLGNYIATIFEGIPNFLLPLVVVNILGAEQNAYFYIAWSISGILLMVPKATSMSLFAEGSNKITSFKSSYRRALLFVLIIQGLLLFFIYIFGENILLLFGSSYVENASEMLWIFSVTSIPYSVIVFYVTTKRIQKSVIEVIFIYVFISLSSIIGGYYFMQTYGLIGVAISWITANTIAATFILIVQSVSSRYLRQHSKMM